MLKKVFVNLAILFLSYTAHAQFINLASNKPTQQSSVSAEGGLASDAVDGDTNGDFTQGSVTQTNNEANPWWQVDLESSREISLIKLYNRTDAFSDRLSNFYVFVSNTDLSGRDFTDIISDCSIAYIHVSETVSSEINLPKVLSGRYVRIQLVGTNVLSLAEVEVYQSNTSGPDCDDFCLIDDFDDRLNGSIRGQGDWETNPPGALDGAIVSSDIEIDGFIEKVLMNDPNGVPFRGNAYKPLGSQSIPKNSKGTLFFQVAADDLANTYSHFGLTDLIAPRLTDGGTGEVQLYQDFEVQLSLDQGQFRVRNGSSNSYLSNIQVENGIVYNVWIVVDNQNNAFEVYVQGGAQMFPLKGKAIDNTSVFSFRNGTTDALQTLYLLNSPDNVDTGILYFDHFYSDNNKENLALPIMASQVLEFSEVDTFETLSLGALDAQNNWTANSNTVTVAVDSENDQNQVMKITSGSMTAHHSIPSIRDCEIGTLYYRIKRTGLVNESVGLSDVLSPTEFSDYECQINLQNDSDTFNGRSGDSFLPLDNLANDIWYCVWMVIDNPNDTYNIYLQGNGAMSPELLSSGDLSDFSFRNNGASNPLTTFFVKQSNSAGTFYIDDIYVAHNKSNLSHPSSGQCDHEGEVVDTSSPLNDPIAETISTDGVGIVLEEFVTIPASSTSSPSTRINFLDHANDSSGRLFVNDLNNKLYMIEDKVVNEYLDVSSQFVNFAEEPRLGSGFGFFSFHPEFATNGKFYTVHTERFDALIDNIPDYTSAGTDDMHGIITEWIATDPTANVFSGSKREVLRIGFDTYLHGFQQIGFNPNATLGSPEYGLLYLALGDGEENPVFSGAPQDLSVPHGKILCIDPAGNNAPNGKYGIPSTNPFVNDVTALGEIWAYGFRNPHRFSWDTAGTNKMFIGNIGEKNIDAIYQGSAGANFGWNEREGAFLFKKYDPNNVYALPAIDANGYTYPVAQYDHDEGFAVVGGFVYRGKALPELQGKYIFGDVVKGRVFYTEESEMNSGGGFANIKEFLIYDETKTVTSMLNLAGNSRADLRFGLDAQEELYLLSKQNGKIWLVTETIGINDDVDDEEDDNEDEEVIDEDEEEKQTHTEIVSYPNPVKDVLHIQLVEEHIGIVKTSLWNLLGQEVIVVQNESDSDVIDISVSEIPNGIYLVKLTVDGITYITKIVKE